MKAAVGDLNSSDKQYTHGIRACPNRNIVRANQGKTAGGVKFGSWNAR